MAEHENAARLRAGYAAFSSGDMEALNEFIPEDAVWHVTGNSALSGEYKGRDAVYGYFGKLMETTAGTFKATLLHVVADDDHSVGMQRSEATINGKQVSTTDVLINREENGEAVETWIYFEDDTILSSYHRPDARVAPRRHVRTRASSDGIA